MESLIEMHEEEVLSPEPFKFNPDPEQPDKDEQNEQEEQDDAGYTPGETEYADGEGTELNQEIETLDDEDEQDENARN